MLPKINTIVYATGLGASAPYVFRYAMCLAQQHQAKLVIVHAMEPLSPFGQSLVELHVSHAASEKMHTNALVQIRGQMEKRLADFVAGESGANASLVKAIKVIEGQPAQVIVAEAKTHHADLIVIGSHRHTALGDALLGHTASKVTHSSEIPVLLVPIPKGFEE